LICSVNALAAAAPNLSDPALRAGLLVSPSLSTASASAALSANGFLNLISVLLGAVDSGNAYGDPGVAQPRTELSQTVSANALYLPAASSADIAQALIRSMLGGKTTPATPVVDRPKTAQTKAKPTTGGQQVSPTSLPIPAVPIPAPLPLSASIPPSAPIPGLPPVQGPLPKTATTAGSLPVGPSEAGNQEPHGTGGGSAQSVTGAMAGAMASAPLAFSARLTPLENSGAENPSAANAPAEPPVAMSSDAKSKAVTPESPNPHRVPRSDASEAALPIVAVAATSTSGGFARGFENPAPPNAAAADIAQARPANAFGTVADTLRTSETANAPSSQTAAAVNNSPVQEIAVRIARPAMPVVDLQVTERAGEIHVAVRTPDTSLETLLRQDLGTLTNSLERAGYRAETYVPSAHDEPVKTAASPPMDFGAERESSGPGSSDRHAGESSQGQQQRQRHNNPQNWNDEMERQQ
jgi:hypothetical protein